jgi:hypothetical protein
MPETIARTGPPTASTTSQPVALSVEQELAQIRQQIAQLATSIGRIHGCEGVEKQIAELVTQVINLNAQIAQLNEEINAILKPAGMTATPQPPVVQTGDTGATLAPPVVQTETNSPLQRGVETTVRPSPIVKGATAMKTFTPIKKSAFSTLKKAAPKAAPVSPTLIDNEDESWTLAIVDATGAVLPVGSYTAPTVTEVSDTPSVLTIDPSSAGLTLLVDCVTAGAANVTVTATAPDGSYGPFTLVIAFTVAAGGPAGLTAIAGTVSVQ